MPKKLSPATVMTLLKKAKANYQKKAPDPKDEAETRHLKINEDLKVLRNYAKKEGTGADLEQKFEAKKTALVKKLKLHFQKVKKAKDKDANKATLPKYLL